MGPPYHLVTFAFWTIWHHGSSVPPGVPLHNNVVHMLEHTRMEEKIELNLRPLTWIQDKN